MIQNDTTLTVRKDYEVNQTRVSEAFYSLLVQNGSVPTQQEIADHLSLSRITVQRHLQTLSLAELVIPLRVAAPRAMAKVIGMALAGSPAALKLYFSLLEKAEEQSKNATRSGSSHTNSEYLSDEMLEASLNDLLGGYLNSHPEVIEQHILKQSATSSQPLLEASYST
jgi:predicted ArsR family transcriptional regulator